MKKAVNVVCFSYLDEGKRIDCWRISWPSFSRENIVPRLAMCLDYLVCWVQDGRFNDLRSNRLNSRQCFSNAV